MGQDGAWAGHPEIYAAAMCYKVEVTIYSKDYAEKGGSLVISDAGETENVVQDRPMIYISYHDNNHFNSVRPPISSQPNGQVFLTGTERLEVDMNRAINDHQEEVSQVIAVDTTANGLSLTEEKRHLLRFASPLSQKKIEAIRQKLKVQEDLDELDELADLETKLFGLIVA